jgi:thioredoxin-dependent peroxiredoxin
MSKFSVGEFAPDFSIEISEGKSLSLASLKGKYVVLYFYPKDDTPGCTIEARDFSSLKKDFLNLGAEIIGISKDTLTSHDKFRKNHDLQIHLGSDTDGSLCEKFSVWGQKSMFGKKYMGIERATFLIDPEGRFAYIWSSVSALGHAKKVLKKLKEIKAI